MRWNRKWIGLAVVKLMLIVALMALVPAATLAQVTTTTVQGTIYRADGTAAQGTLLVSWPAFTTPGNQAVAAGSISTTIGRDGFVSLALAPNQNALPAGTYYTAVYHLNDGTVNKEYWVVPAAGSASIGTIRALVVPATVAVQSVSKSYVDSSISSISSTYLPLTGGSMSGPLNLSGDPSGQLQPTTKRYVDSAIANTLPLTGGTLLGGLQAPSVIAKGPVVQVTHPDFGLGQPVKSVTVSNGACTSSPTITFPAPYFSADGSTATGIGYCVNGQTVIFISFPGGGYIASQTPTITGGGTSGAMGTLVLVGTANAADPTGVLSSSAPILNAIDYAYTIVNPTYYSAAVRIPAGKYSITDTIRRPDSVCVSGDSPTSTVLSGVQNSSNVFTGYNVGSHGVYGNTDVCGVSNMTITTPNGHNYQATLLEENYPIGNHFNDLVITNGGGRGMWMLNGGERNDITHIDFSEVRWPLLATGNENRFRTVNVNSPGQSGDSYCFDPVNCPNGVPQNYYWNGGTLAAATANGTTASFYLHSSGNGAALSPNTSPIGIGHTFVVAGTTGTVLDGTYVVTSVANNVTSDPSGSCTPSNPCFEVQAGSMLSGTANISAATWKPAGFPGHNFAIVVGGEAVKFDGGSIKVAWYGGCFDLESAGTVSIVNYYCEGYPLGSGEPHLFPTLQETTYPYQTVMTGSLAGTAGLYTVVPVQSTMWTFSYYNDPNDASFLAGTAGWDAVRVVPQDYQYGNTSPSAYVTGVNRNQWEDLQVAFSQDGMHIHNRNLSDSTAPPNTAWPAGSLVVFNPSYGESFGSSDVMIHDQSIDNVPSPTSPWVAECSDSIPSQVCATYIIGAEPNYITTFDQQHLAPAGSSGPRGNLTIRGDEDITSGFSQYYETQGNGYIKVVGMGGYAERLQSGAPNPGAYDESETTGQMWQDDFVDLTNSVGNVVYENPEEQLRYFGGSGFTKQVNKGGDSVTGGNPGLGAYNQGTEFATSTCQYDLPASVGGHSLNRWCYKGSPTLTGSNSGFEYDLWNGSSWLSGFGLSPGSNNTINLSNTGNSQVGGSLKASSINGEITVDGVTYSTLNAAWNAAVSQANTTGLNQTIKLGPGSFAVTAAMTEPSNGACVSVLGSAGTATAADVTTAATTLNVTTALSSDVFFAGNTAQAQGCTFKDLNILANRNAQHGFEMQWFRSLLIDNVAVNDTVADGLLLGEETTASGHQANFLLRNVVVSYNASNFTPANRPAYGVHLQKTAIDSHLDDIFVRNALTASVYNEGTGNTGYLIHGFGYPYTCSTGPCSNTAASSSASNASYATNYVIYDTGGSGSVWTDTYFDSPAAAGIYVGANGVSVHGGHIQWPDLTSFPSANLAYVASTVSSNLLIADVDCLGMSSSANWISYGLTAGNPPTFSSVHHLTGCGNYYQALEPAVTTGFSSGGANINDSSGAVPRVWATPLAASASDAAYAAQLYTGYQGDAFQAHFSGASPFFNITYQGTVRSNGGLALSTVINTAAALTLTTANKNVISNASSGAQTLTLPSCYTALPDKMSPTGLELTIVKSDTSSNAVTLQTVSSQAINYQGLAAQSLAISSPGKRTLVCGPDDNWYAF